MTAPNGAARQMPDLHAEAVSVRYGGHLAVDAVSVHAQAGRITGLIGPNGAGKTSFFNACTGVVRSAGGRVRLGDDELTRLSPAQRAQRGLGRTFQRIELFDSMTVLENVRMGPETRLAGRNPARLLLATRAERAEIRDRADDAIERCGLSSLGRDLVQDLSTGQLRLVEVARAIATGFSFLLLDEPSSGLDVRETARMSAVLQELVTRDGMGILIVEHDMSLVRAVCDYAYVLDFGELLCHGETSEVLSSAIVRTAYLGTQGAA